MKAFRIPENKEYFLTSTAIMEMIKETKKPAIFTIKGVSEHLLPDKPGGKLVPKDVFDFTVGLGFPISTSWQWKAVRQMFGSIEKAMGRRVELRPRKAGEFTTIDILPVGDEADKKSKEREFSYFDYALQLVASKHIKEKEKLKQMVKDKKIFPYRLGDSIYFSKRKVERLGLHLLNEGSSVLTFP